MKKIISIPILLVIAFVLYRLYKKSNISLLGKVPKKPAKIRIVYSKKMKPSERTQITSSEAVVNVLRKIWSNQMEVREEFIILLLDRGNNVLGYHIVSMGGVSGTVIDTKIILSVALESLASSIILAHNHPSGNQQPSQADISLTKKIMLAAQHVDIKVLDHIILTKHNYYSFADEGVM
ncbi:MAG: JAB domain-containing protein [Flavobacteriales bacterium]|nr:JAB domain-containing protein [Flavobacteriales bacterium]